MFLKVTSLLDRSVVSWRIWLLVLPDRPTNGHAVLLSCLWAANKIVLIRICKCNVPWETSMGPEIFFSRSRPDIINLSYCRFFNMRFLEKSDFQPLENKLWFDSSLFLGIWFTCCWVAGRFCLAHHLSPVQCCNIGNLLSGLGPKRWILERKTFPRFTFFYFGNLGKTQPDMEKFYFRRDMEKIKTKY